MKMEKFSVANIIENKQCFSVLTDRKWWEFGGFVIEFNFIERDSLILDVKTIKH